MHRTTRSILLALGVTMSFAAMPAAAQHPQVRHGFWFNAGLAYGSLGCSDCGDRLGGRSGGFSLGGVLSPNILLGAGTTFWTKSEAGDRVTVGTLDARFRFYPKSRSGFFITSGLGIGSIRASSTSFAEHVTETGLGLLLGLGYDFRIGTNVSLTPFFNGYAVRASGADANVGQIGLSVTVH